jgi:hypothetical protein
MRIQPSAARLSGRSSKTRDFAIARRVNVRYAAQDCRRPHLGS